MSDSDNHRLRADAKPTVWSQIRLQSLIEQFGESRARKTEKFSQMVNVVSKPTRLQIQHLKIANFIRNITDQITSFYSRAVLPNIRTKISLTKNIITPPPTKAPSKVLEKQVSNTCHYPLVPDQLNRQLSRKEIATIFLPHQFSGRGSCFLSGHICACPYPNKQIVKQRMVMWMLGRPV